MNTASIAYNYAIAITLFNSKVMIAIKREITILIYDQIGTIDSKYRALGYNDQEIFKEIKKLMFRDVINEAGQLDEPLISINNKLVPVKNLLELKRYFIPSLNIRELMSITKNFHSSQSSCFMFSILIEYVEYKNKNNVSFFTKKYPMLDIKNIESSVRLIEKILGFDIEEVNKCYNNLNGEKIINTTKCKPLYLMMQNEFLDPKTKQYTSPITICWLWHALVYGVPYQDVLKLPSSNYIKQLSTSYKVESSNTMECMGNVLNYFKIFPPLSIREKKYITSKGTKPLVDGLYERPPWTPPICYMKPIEPLSFSLNIQKKYDKFFVSNLSGHTMIFIIVARFFKNININLIILACIIYMTPYNHSIHEILKAANIVDANPLYNIRNTDLDNINKLITSINIPSMNYTPLDKNTVEKVYKNIVSKIPADSPYYPKIIGGNKKSKTKSKNKTKNKNTSKSKSTKKRKFTRRI